MAKKKRMTNREKDERARLKKELQAKGVIAPDKPRLNRNRFIEEAMAEWDARDRECLIWDYYLLEAVSVMLGKSERRSTRASPEAVGVAKVLKTAIRLREFHEGLREKGQKEYRLTEMYDYIRDITEA